MYRKEKVGLGLSDCENGHTAKPNTKYYEMKHCKAIMDDSNKNSKQDASPDSLDCGVVEKRKLSDAGSHKISKKAKKDKEIPIHMVFAKQPMLEKDIYNETEYYFQDGFRKVWPYYFEYNTFAKGRWLGKTLREVYTKEFRRYPIEYYENAVKTGSLLINKKIIKSLEVRFTENSMVTVRVHRHEYAVTNSKIKVLIDDDRFLVINKPSSIPIHPCGRYRNNTLIFILAKEFGYKDIFLCHRIDRLTSGIVIFAKTKEIAKQVTKEIADRKVEKHYLCKVKGEFPLSQKNETISCEQPVTIFNPKLGYAVAWKVEGLNSKEAYTEFERLSTNGKESIVLCKPKTGRTHQIRVHLQYLGYPITNDPVYNHSAWGEERFQYGECRRNLDEVSDEITSQYQNNEKERSEKTKSDQAVDNSSKGPSSVPVLKVKTFPQQDRAESTNPGDIKFSGDGRETEIKDGAAEEKDSVESSRFALDCDECCNPLPDPLPESLTICLHAHKYKGTDWYFETEMPDWCSLN